MFEDVQWGEYVWFDCNRIFQDPQTISQNESYALFLHIQQHAKHVARQLQYNPMLVAYVSRLPRRGRRAAFSLASNLTVFENVQLILNFCCITSKNSGQAFAVSVLQKKVPS